MIELRNLRDDYHKVLQRVRLHGKPVKVRGMETLEILDETLVIQDPTDVFPWGTGRGVNPAIAAVEALQLIGGVSHPDLMVKASSNFAQFRDGGAFHGAYGPRIRQQLPAVVKRLQKDINTRQACIVIWEPLRDLYEDGLKDYPCTMLFQFLVREEKLQLHTTMRSNDVWWGLAYDAFQFTQLQLTVASALGLDAGPYFHHAVSFHMYERDLEASRKVHGNQSGVSLVDPPPLGMGHADIKQSMRDARALLNGKGVIGKYGAWYEKALDGLFT